jgi:hypothetical protein
MLMPLRGGRDGTALQLEIQLTTLDQLDKFRHRGVRSSEAASRMKAFGALLPPPAVEILRADEMKAS